MPSTSAGRRKLYIQRKKNGCCPRCGQKVRKNSKFSFCDDCRSFFRSYFSEISDRINIARKARYDKRKKNSQCPRCGKPLDKRYSKIICKKCLDKQYEYNYGAKRKKKPNSVKKDKAVRKPTSVSKPKIKPSTGQKIK
jgi:Zn finger protein HypA/HybF involved in hydrogenase expression